MMTESDIYNMLQGQKLSQLTLSNLDTPTARSFINAANMEFWKGIITLSQVMKAARTYPHGIVIPESGTVLVTTVADSASASVTPTGTEVWRVQNLDADNCSVSLKDDDGNLSPMTIVPAGGQFQTTTFSLPFYLTNTMSIVYTNASGGEQTPSIAYHKVSL